MDADSGVSVPLGTSDQIGLQGTALVVLQAQRRPALSCPQSGQWPDPRPERRQSRQSGRQPGSWPGSRPGPQGERQAEKRLGPSPRPPRFPHHPLAEAVLGALLAASVAGPAQANPSGGQVAYGSGSIAGGGTNNMNIQQNSARMTVNWQGYSIGGNESVTYHQPGASAIALNRVLGADPSNIQGHLNANGQVYLVNPNGVLFGQGAQVNVGGLVASSLPMSEQAVRNFQAGGPAVFRGNGNNATVTNQGTITAADGGSVALVGGQVVNSGMIAARLGTVALAAGNQVTVDYKGDGQMSLTVDEGTVKALVANKHIIQAPGGQVYLTAKARDAVSRSSINNEGIIRASGMVQRGGVIELVADNVTNAGTLDVSAAGATSGAQAAQAGHVSLRGGTVINTGTIAADGPTGGTVEIRGRDVVQAGTVSARGLGTQGLAGNGGSVTLAGTHSVRHAATARTSVHGSRNGGSVRISGGGKGGATVSGEIDASGSGGQGGPIVVKGRTVALQGATLDANGATGGGQVKIGGGLHGQDATVLNATATRIDASTRIHADATGSGNGGTVIVWSNGATRFAGEITARGGPQGGPGSGNGGFVETSGHTLGVTGQVNTLAPLGTAGTWLLDPQDFTIAAAGGDMTGAVLTANLALGNISINSSAGATAGTGNIWVNDVVAWAANNLTLTAANHINVAALMTVSGTGTLTLNTGGALNIQPGGGRIDFTGAGAGLLTINGTGYTVINSLGAQASKTTTDLQGMQGNLGGHYALGANIDASATSGWNGGAGFAPVGQCFDCSGTSFAGVFDGLGHSIAGLTISTTASEVGLFGAAAYGSVVRNVGLVGGAITGASYVGGLVGHNGGTVSNSFVTGAVSGTGNYVGGLVGYNSAGTVSNSYATGAVSGVSQVGGLVGFNNRSTVTNSYATGAVTGNNGNVGGLVGYNNSGTVSNSFATGAVRGTGYGTGNNVGGLVGYNSAGTVSNGTVSNSYATGAVSGVSQVGGLVGQNYGAVADSYATGAVTGTGSNIGGLVGTNGSISATATVSNSYATGAVTGPVTSSVGGLMGSNYGGSSATNGFWNTTVSGALPGVGSNFGGGTLTNVTGLTSAQMQSSASFTGFSFAGTWQIPAAGNSYLFPILQSTPRAVTATVTSASRLYGAANPVFTATYTNISPTDPLFTGAGVNFFAANGTAPVGAATAVGSYSLQAAALWGQSQPVFVVGSIPGTLTITPAPLTVTANNASKSYGQTLSLAGTAFVPTGLVNGETVGSVTLTSAGTASTAGVAGSPYAIVASNATGGTFNPANYTITYVNGALSVAPVPLLVTANAASKVYGQSLAFAGTEFTATGMVNGETVGAVTLISAGTAATAGVKGSPYAIAASNATGGGTFNASNYTITYVNGALTVTPARLLVTANNASHVFGQALILAGAAFTSIGLVNGETVGAVTLTSAGTAATAGVAGSPYAIVASRATGGTFDPTNYTIAYANGALTVTPAPLLVTANNASLLFNGQPFLGGNGVAYAGFVNGEGSGALGGLLTYGGNSQGAINPGTYGILPGGLYSSNYLITFAPGTLTINPAPTAIAPPIVATALPINPPDLGQILSYTVSGDSGPGSNGGTAPILPAMGFGDGTRNYPWNMGGLRVIRTGTGNSDDIGTGTSVVEGLMCSVSDGTYNGGNANGTLDIVAGGIKLPNGVPVKL